MRGDHSPNDSVQGCVHVTVVEQIGAGRGADRESGVKEGLPEEEKRRPGLADGGEGRGQGRVGIDSLPLLQTLYRSQPPAVLQTRPRSPGPAIAQAIPLCPPSRSWFCP